MRGQREFLPVWKYKPMWDKHSFLVIAKTKDSACGVLQRAKSIDSRSDSWIRVKSVWATGKERMLYL